LSLFLLQILSEITNLPSLFELPAAGVNVNLICASVPKHELANVLITDRKEKNVWSSLRRLSLQLADKGGNHVLIVGTGKMQDDQDEQDGHGGQEESNLF
jgi:hypothetical protein